jgi:hypothetical protein
MLDDLGPVVHPTMVEGRAPVWSRSLRGPLSLISIALSEPRQRGVRKWRARSRCPEVYKGLRLVLT